ncbi:MAG: division/cell wall cluster transcriptional repressor MraZ [Planctomycetes bacterium]|nr:division/cell wall cluster transcriptional repressor MraZ [Planctomycetota bacterium]
MLLTGCFLRSVDEKWRVALPKPIRDALGELSGVALYVAPGTDGSLVVYTEQSFLQLAEKVAQGPPTSEDVRAFSRLFYAQAQRVEVDRQGRIRVPAELAALALPGREIMLLGVRDHLEIWDRQHWEAYLSEKQPYYDRLAESAFGGPVRQVAAAEVPSHAVQPRQPR